MSHCSFVLIILALRYSVLIIRCLLFLVFYPPHLQHPPRIPQAGELGIADSLDCFGGWYSLHSSRLVGQLAVNLLQGPNVGSIHSCLVPSASNFKSHDLQ